MARRKKTTDSGDLLSSVQDYRHEEAKRVNNPPAKIAAEGTVPLIPKARYHYSPRRPPELRFDPAGKPDTLPELVQAAQRRKLTADEAKSLAEALRTHEPWLEWTEKREQHQRGFFEVDPVALHIHERVSAQAILCVAARQDPQRDLFADTQLEYHQAVQFYRHEVDWSNRLILGDSLQVMSSLARREDLAGKVQMIYMDPPYGIKFASNFQPEVGRRDVRNTERDLTREPEMVRAYRDTWHLGVHSYLSYLRDRLMVAKELLTDSGSIFVQISDENVHRVRCLMEEIFGQSNFVSLVTFAKTSSSTGGLLSPASDYLLWFARDITSIRYRKVFVSKEIGGEGASAYRKCLLSTGERTILAASGNLDVSDYRVYRFDNITSQSIGREKGEGAACWFPVTVDGKDYRPNPRSRWKTNEAGMRRLLAADRVEAGLTSLGYVRFIEDFVAYEINNRWEDTSLSGAMDKAYVVQTGNKVIERCMLMTTEPGDLVLDPTCGSGTTAYVAEQWGRRWITADTSRVAVAIARQRLLTAKYEMYRVAATSPSQITDGGAIGKCAKEDCGEDAAATKYSSPSGGICVQNRAARDAEVDCAEHEPRSDLRQARPYPRPTAGSVQ